MFELKQIKKTYVKEGKTIQALKKTDLTTETGEFVAVQGPSGSGKTTLLLIAGGLLHPDEGQVLVDGKDLYKMKTDTRTGFRSRYIGFVFQQYHLIPYLSVLENIVAPSIVHGRHEHWDRGIELIKQFGLQHRENHVPAELSAGEKQRTALARALFFRPQILLADEITGNLDHQNAQIVIGCLKEHARQGGTVLLVTHDQEVAAQADRMEQLHNATCERNES